MSHQLPEILSRIKKMHTKFGITCDEVPFSLKEKEFRIMAMQEELDEYIDAETREDELDALIDLIVFALGTAERQGMLEVFNQGFNRVMAANCMKEIGPNKKRDSFALDLVKPKGWQSPVLSDLVEELE
jgi:predicted HAD superfamily Cof-like phosphohydrolase